MGWGRRDCFLPVLDTAASTTDRYLIIYYKPSLMLALRILTWSLLLAASGGEPMPLPESSLLCQ